MAETIYPTHLAVFSIFKLDFVSKSISHSRLFLMGIQKIRKTNTKDYVAIFSAVVIFIYLLELVPCLFQETFSISCKVGLLVDVDFL